MSQSRNFQTGTPAIRWGDRITRGLRHVIVPQFGGIGSVIPDLVDKNCGFQLVNGSNLNVGGALTKPDTWTYAQVGSSDWRLKGPQIVLDYNKDFSLFIRAIGLSSNAAYNGLWGVGSPGLGYGAEFLAGDTGSRFVTQWGQWSGGSFNSQAITDASWVTATRWSSVGFTWNGTTKRFHIAIKVDAGNTVHSIGDSTGITWTPIGGGASGTQDTEWGFQTHDGVELTILSHMYMWEAEVAAPDLARLMDNPTAIFGPVQRNLYVRYVLPPTNVTITGGTGVFVLAGQDANLVGTNPQMTAAPGVFTLTGNDAALSSTTSEATSAVHEVDVYAVRGMLETWNLFVAFGLTDDMVANSLTVAEIEAIADGLLSHSEYDRIHDRVMLMLQRADELHVLTDMVIATSTTTAQVHDHILAFLPGGVDDGDIYSAYIQGT